MATYLLRTKDNCFYNLATSSLKSAFDKENLIAKTFLKVTDLTGQPRFVAVDVIADIAPVADAAPTPTGAK